MKKRILLLSAMLAASIILSGCKATITPSNETAAVQTDAPAQTEAATEVPTAAPTEAPTQSAEPVDASWFDDAVFIGDSITVALDYACAGDASLLGDAKFVCAQSLGYHNALWPLDTEGAVHPTYQGKTILSETAAEVTGASKVFILLGVNDIGTYGAEDTFDQAKELARRILERTPDVTLYFQSATPMLEDKESGWLNNDKITAFNELLEAYCAQQGWHFIDLYHQVCDENGKLREDYCGDPEVQGIHFNTEGCTVWADHLKASVNSSAPAASVDASANTAANASASSGQEIAYSAYDSEEADSGDSYDEGSYRYNDEPDEINYYVSDEQ